MTAYGRACVASSFGRIIVEIQSVNRKHLEINSFLPKELVRFDAEIKQWVGARIHRGQVTFKVTACFDTESPTVVAPNLPLARQLKKAWDQIATELGIEKEFSLELLAKENDLLLYEEDLKDEEGCRKALHEATSHALSQMMEMKRKEGEALRNDISSRLERLETLIKKAEDKAPDAPKKFRQKLTERLEEVLQKGIENEERILREVCVYAEKVDIAEEITRFKSHLKQFETLLNKESLSIGKTMDFLVQELNREINTVGSKASDIELSHLVVDIKGELERIREQIQNIE